MNSFIKLIFLLCLISITGALCGIGNSCFKEVFQTVKSDSTRTILFVGNSLTYTNDLPQLVEEAGRRKNIDLKTEMLAFPDYAIHDHWEEGKVQTLILANKYDFVVIQQGPSSQQDGLAILLEYGPKYNELCKESGSKLTYYMVWPALANYDNFDGVIKNYSEAAEATNSILCPVGKVWKTYFDETNDFSYYGGDKFHPSLKGSKIAAEVIVDSLFN